MQSELKMKAGKTVSFELPLPSSQCRSIDEGRGGSLGPSAGNGHHIDANMVPREVSQPLALEQALGNRRIPIAVKSKIVAVRIQMNTDHAESRVCVQSRKYIMQTIQNTENAECKVCSTVYRKYKCIVAIRLCVCCVQCTESAK